MSRLRSIPRPSSRLGDNTAGGCRQREDLDQHRPSSEQPALRRSCLHRLDRASHRPDSFRADPESEFAAGRGDRGKPFRRDLDRHRLVSISEYDRANLRDRRRYLALRRQCRAASASYFTKVTRAAASSFCASCLARCASMPTAKSRASVCLIATANELGREPRGQ